jgi:hypothetical protein
VCIFHQPLPYGGRRMQWAFGFSFAQGWLLSRAFLDLDLDLDLNQIMEWCLGS